MPGSFGRLLQFESSTQRVCGLRQPAGGLLDLRHMVQRLGRIDALSGHGQSLGLSQQRTLVVRSPRHRSRIGHQGFFEMTQPKQHATETRVGQGPRRSDGGGRAVRRQGLLQGTAQDGHVPEAQRFLVALV